MHRGYWQAGARVKQKGKARRCEVGMGSVEEKEEDEGHTYTHTHEQLFMRQYLSRCTMLPDSNALSTPLCFLFTTLYIMFQVHGSIIFKSFSFEFPSFFCAYVTSKTLPHTPRTDYGNNDPTIFSQLVSLIFELTTGVDACAWLRYERARGKGGISFPQSERG